MGFSKPSVPPVEPDKVYDLPYLERIRILSRYWAENGFGSPKIFHVIYIVKLLFFYIAGGYLVGTLTSGFHPLHRAGCGPSRWSTRSSSCGPCCSRRSAWPGPGVRWPGTSSRSPAAGATAGSTRSVTTVARQGAADRGDRRRPVDVGLYLAIIVTLVLSLVLPTVDDAGLTAPVSPAAGCPRC